jgi:3-oxoacyl-[acyl-carrier protein] reductase
MNTVLVTGASGDLGAAIATRLGREGNFVWVHYHTHADRAAVVVSAITAAGGAAQVVQFDCGVESEVAAGLTAIAAEGPLYGLVNVAGIVRDGLFAAMSFADFSTVIENDLVHLYHVTRGAIRAMLQAGQGGRVVMIASVAGERGNRGQGNYSAAKAGIIGLTKSLAQEYASRNILVNAVSPGLIESRMTAHLPPEALDFIPLKRYGTPADVAGAVNFLLSEDAAYITGQVVRVNGGLYM